MSDPQSQWASTLLDSLVEAGVRDAVISPGSRSTPLTWAASRTRGLRCHALIDERSAGFYALGQARVSGVPSLLICTSGTAASNYFPAVIEAREGGLPLIVLSADRPFELQHCGAHQTIDQTRLFGAYAPYHELGTPVGEREALLGLRRVAWQAVMTSLEAPRGAVHLNFRAKKPLEPSAVPPSVELPPAPARAPLGRQRASRVSASHVDTLLGALDAAGSPLLICGAESIHDSASAELVERFADLTGSVVCPESVSQLRFQLGGSGRGVLVCDTYDWLLSHAALARTLAPDFALQLGGTPVSATLERLVQAPERGLRYAIAAESGWPDPLHKSADILRGRSSDLLEAACTALERRGTRARRPRLGLWREAQAAAAAAVARHVRGSFGEAAAVVEACAHVPAGSLLALGNSLPPRLIDRYVAAAGRGVRVLCQRGAAGIEGAVAGVLGAATQEHGAVTLLLGDISFLHDIGSLWAALPSRTHSGPRTAPVVIIVLNNGGGRIFEQLPIAAHPDVALELWTTPHALELRAAAELYGIGYAAARERDELTRALGAAYATSGVTLVEVLVAPDSAIQSQRSVTADLDSVLSALAQSGA